MLLIYLLCSLLKEHFFPLFLLVVKLEMLLSLVMIVAPSVTL